MAKAEIVHINDNGDIEYKVLNESNFFLRGMALCLVFLFISFFCFLIQEWVILSFLNTISFIFVLLSIILVGFLCCRNEMLIKEEAALVTEAIYIIAEQEAVRQNQSILKIKFCSKSSNSHGTIDEEYVLVLLSNKTIMKCPIEQLNREDKHYNHKLIKKEFLLCENDNLSEKIVKTKAWNNIIKSPFFIRTIIWIIIIGILLIGCGIIFLLKILYDICGLRIISLFFILFLLIISFYDYLDKLLPKNWFCNIMRGILLIPVFIFSLNDFVMPFMTIVMAIIFILFFSLLPVLLVLITVKILGYDITLNAIRFIFFTFPFVIATQCSGIIRNLILKYTIFSEKEHHYQLFMRELVKFLYTKENLNFIFYAAYSFFLIVSTFKTLQTGGPLLSQEVDLIVAKSFLVYIACTNMFDRKKSSSIEGKNLLSLIIKILLVRDTDKIRVKK